MAKITDNHLVKNVRGMFGKQIVYKERLGTPYVAAPPDVDENRVVTGDEQGNRNQFGDAVRTGKKNVKIPELKAEYAALAKVGQTAYNVAVSDARLPPKINSLLTQGYTGKAGSCILVQATDNIKVKRVTVSIYDSEKSLVEENEAVENGDGFNWIFTATVSVESIAGCVIEARAYDIAKNEAVKVAFLD